MEEAKETVGSAKVLVEFKEYRRKQTTELRPYTLGEKLDGKVSISHLDKEAGSPKMGDMIARNPKNHEDQWLMSAEYFKDNFAEMDQPQTDNLSFGHAIDALKQGKRVTREEWSDRRTFIFMQVPSAVSIDIVPKMTSLPQLVKDIFEKRKLSNEGRKLEFEPYHFITYQNQLAMVYPDNRIYGWVASPSDILEEDWIILD